MGVTEAAKGARDAGEPAFGVVYVESRARLVRVAFLIVGSTAVAEEVVQEAFANLLVRFDQVEQPAAYARTSVVRLALKWKKRRAMEADRIALIGDPGPVGDADVDEIWGLLCRLRPERRAVVVLRFYEDLTHAEIAEVLGTPEATVRTRLHRALGDLRKELCR
jgi:RNA polymerase sigma factor (sigma-70 family)